MKGVVFLPSCLQSIFILLGLLPLSASGQSAPASSCPALARMPLQAQQITSNAIDPAYGSYLTVRHGNQTSVFRVERNQLSGALTVVPVVDTALSGNVSVAFHNGNATFAHSTTDPVSLSEFISSPDLVQLPAFSLSSGAQNQTTSFSDPSQSNRSSSTSSPFWIKRQPYSPWEQRVCPAGATASGQRGRVMTSLGANQLVVANNFEFSSNYFDLPYSCGQQVYERNSDGSTKMRVARNPAAPNFYCDLTRPRPGVLGCQAVGTYQSPGCIEIVATPTPAPTPPVGATPTPTPSPTPPPANACSVRMEPDPIENAAGQPPEFCPGCEYYWWAMDPAFSIFTRLPSGQMVKSGSFHFPQSFSTGHVEIPVPPTEFSLGSILQLRPDSLTGGFAAATELSADDYPELANVGGVYFFNANGSFAGFASAFFEGGRTGTSLAALGSYDGSTVYALGSPENARYHGDSTGIPPEWLGLIRPQAGHVLFTKQSGEFVGLFFGKNANDRYGNSVATLGDIGNDGAPKAIIGAPGGQYVNFTRASRDSYNEIGTLRDDSSPGFGTEVGAVSTANNGVADVFVVASSNELIFYDAVSCLDRLVPSLDPLLHQALVKVQAAIDALDMVDTPAPPQQQAATASVSLLEDRLNALLIHMTQSQMFEDIDTLRLKISNSFYGLKNSLLLHDAKQSELATLEAKQIAAKKIVEKLKKKKKNAGGRLSTKDAAKLRKNSKTLKNVARSLPTVTADISTSTTRANDSKDTLRTDLVDLRTRIRLM